MAVTVWMRRRLRLTASAIAGKLGLPRATVARWLTRAGLGTLARHDPPEPVRRYQRDRPGELLHPDIKKLGRFDRPGHRVSGTRRGCRNRGAGWDRVHVAVDDATRLAYVEVLPDERKDTTSAFLMRALRRFRAHGIRAERIMTDTGSAYRSAGSARRCGGWASATSTPGPTPPGPTARQRGSSRPFCAIGTTVSRTRHRPPEMPTCRDGLTGSTDQDRTPPRTASHRSLR
ncbi:DDE-type integrase/transposase/recombinase [Rhodobacteraceae bacterium 2CG4]|uniref:DDE-type integrase/transposase/recombinase n=1 Tax=Halovulum marinum TaxID=2662447 RepID=A0A6L5Z7B9_9RHOB|nr:DDE-type integrase/transposase/recombinase [Halovulum marinum]MSU92327.1 DDE-type integrase/transposase/recombinase [Halovulum marinum]